MYIYDWIAILLISICHIYLYLKLINYKRFSSLLIVFISFIFMIIVLIVVTMTRLPEFNALLLLIFLLSLGLLQQKRGLTFTRSLFYALISSVIITLLRMVLLEISFFIFMKSPFNLYRWTGSVLHLISVSVIFILLIMCHKQIIRAIRFMRESKLYSVTYAILVMTFFILLVLTTFSGDPLNMTNMTYSKISYIISIILFLLLLLIFVISSHLAKTQLIEKQQEQLDDALIDYVEKLEVMHDELSSFRHDYMNVLLSLDSAIRTNDLERVKHVYNNTVAQTTDIVNNQELDLVKLGRVSVNEVKSILTVKTIEAQQNGITVLLDIPHKINTIPISLVSFIRAISIILDNAIEAAVKSEQKLIDIAFFETDDKQFFIVRNSMSHDDNVDIQTMFDKYYTSKGDKRGYGLFSLKRLIEKIPNATLETEYSLNAFSQIISIKLTGYDVK